MNNKMNIFGYVNEYITKMNNQNEYILVMQNKI